MLKKIWHDPVWSKVIAVALVAIAGLVAQYFFDWWPSVRTFFTQQSTLPNWALAILGLCAALVAAVLAGIVYGLMAKPNSTAPVWTTYTTDQFFGLRWRWRYLAGIAQPLDMVSFCPKCDLQIHPRHASSYDALDGTDFFCEGCARLVVEVPDSVASLEDKVARFIQQKLRNGTWALPKAQ